MRTKVSRRAWPFRRLRMGLPKFIVLVCLANLILFQRPLLEHAIPIADFPSLHSWAILVTIQMIQFCLLAWLLFLVSLLSSFVLRVFCSVLFFTNASAMYFMVTYGVQLDRTMVGNILNTNVQEAVELWHPMALVYLSVLGAIPSAIILHTKITMIRWYWRILTAFGSLLILAIWCLAFSFTWLWFDRYANSLGSKVLPWSYIINLGRFAAWNWLDNREQIDLPEATFIVDDPQNKEVVVLVLGEASRSENHSYYGYEFETNPFTMEKGMQALPPGPACATYTRGAAACILTHEGQDAPPWTLHEPLPNYLKRHGVETIVRVNNSGWPPLDVDRFERISQIAQQCEADDCQIGYYDTMLLYGLDDLIGQSESQRIFVFLHLVGSHGPAYFTRYPLEFKHFTPVCETVQLAECSNEQLVNTYNNTIRFTDSFLADLISILETFEEVSSTVIYVSDHGQSLGENGLYLHGTPQVIAPDEQRMIPFLVWMSDVFRLKRGIGNEGFSILETFPHDFPFHSVMGAFGMRSEIYKPQYDIFNIEDK